MISLEEASSAVLGACRSLAPQRLAPLEAIGCVLAADAVALDDVPPFDNSAVDGYALRAADVTTTPATLRVVETVMAGAVPGSALGPLDAVRIMTGAPVPDGADAICMVERTAAPDGGPSDPDGAQVVILEAVSRGDGLRRRASDVAAGTAVFPAGTVLGPAHLGVLLNTGIVDVLVTPRPRVGVLSTGDELSGARGPLAPGMIRDSNRASLLAQLGRDGFAPIDLGLAPDDADTIRDRIADGAARCDAVVTSGGVSVGDHDLVRTVLSELGGDSMRWMQIAIRPAKPFAFGLLGDGGVPVFGVPGNPVSALVSYEVLVRPALRLLAGHRSLERPRLRATAPNGLARRSDGKLHLQRVQLEIDADGLLVVSSSGGQSSHQLRAMADANGLALVPDGDGVEPGGVVEVLLLDADRLAPPSHDEAAR